MALQYKEILLILYLNVNVFGQYRNCFLSENGSDYTGHTNVTQSGRHCQRWDSLHSDNVVYPQLFNQANHCRNPDNSQRPWCYTADGDWEYCAVYNCEGLNECYMTEKGTDYFGTKNVTKNGKGCQPWDAQEPHEHRFSAMSDSQNFCRNPDFEPGPWCYTNEDDTRWELCGIPKCNITGDTCYKKGKAYLYTGKINITETGYPCQRWDSQTPNRHVYDSYRDLQNYCRTPDGGDVPWCYSMNPTKRWEKCDIIACGEGNKLGCPENWNSFSDTCYQIHRKSVNWTTASTQCKAAKSELVSVLSAKEHQYVYSKIFEDLCFNALDDADCENRSTNGECASNFIFMTKNCRKSCYRCSVDCNSESSTNCRWWANSGECTVNPRYMLVNCAKACKTCQEIYDTKFWIGLKRLNNQSIVWSDGQEVVQFNVTTDVRYPPTNLTGGNCGSIGVENGTWSGANCSDALAGYVCKLSKTAIPNKRKRSCIMEYNGKCYSFHTQRLSWVDAENYCVTNESGHLAAVTDGYIQAFVASEMPGKYKNYWIGLSGSFSLFKNWTNGANASFTFWDPTVTDDDSDGCAVIQQQDRLLGLWKKFDCTGRHPFICENSTDTNITTVSLSMTTDKSSSLGIGKLPNSLYTLLQKVRKYQENGCKFGWLLYKNNCYRKLYHPWSWSDGRSHCMNMKADLASIHNEGEETFIRSKFLRNESLWIGLSFSGTDVVVSNLGMSRSWSDGTRVNYTKFSNAEMLTGKCSAMVKGVTYWSNDQCSIAHQVLCKMKPKVSCGTPPEVQNAFVPAGSSKSGSTRKYQCKDGFTAGSGSPIITCTDNLEWSTPKIKCYENCYRQDEAYYGNYHITETGKTCLPWDADNPRSNYYKKFPNAVENYCRSYNHDQPWCYVQSTKFTWENCKVSKCSVSKGDSVPSVAAASRKADNKVTSMTTEFKSYLGAVVAIIVICLLLLIVVTAFSVYFVRLLRPSAPAAAKPEVSSFENALYLNSSDSTINPDTDQLCVSTVTTTSSSS